jgi:hypothetical protein
MIAFTACDSKYFNMYFKYWAFTFNKFYPGMRKFVAIAHATPAQIAYTKRKDITPIIAGVPDKDPGVSDWDYIGVYHSLRWRYLPWDQNDYILQTQVNCLPIKTQKFTDLKNIQHLRISRLKRGNPGGISAAVFSPGAAKAIAEESEKRLKNPTFGDHLINKWQGENIPSSTILAEKRISNANFVIEKDTYWITASSIESVTHEKKIHLLEMGLSKAGINTRAIK